MANMVTPQIPFIIWLLSLVSPFIMMMVSVAYFVFASLVNPNLLLTFQIDKIRSKSFAYLWTLLGPLVADDFPSPNLDEIINDHCHGTVLDVGPGSGFQLKRFKVPFMAGKITKIYAVEPGAEMHDQLRAEAIKIFGGAATSKYNILNAGAHRSDLVPALAKNGILGDQTEEFFDTIMCIRVLCGIPDPKDTAELFYRLLKPGGRIIFFEHVVNTGDSRHGGSLVASLFQKAYMVLGWSFWSGGCELTRDTANNLREAASSDGGWLEEKVFQRKPEACIPEIYGYMRKSLS